MQVGASERMFKASFFCTSTQTTFAQTTVKKGKNSRIR